MRVAIDCRYVRERPSGIGAYVKALVDRLPALAPDDQFRFWVDPRAPRPLSGSANVDERQVPAPANGLRTLVCPARLSELDGIEAFHAPFNILGRGIGAPAVVTIHDLMWLIAPALSEGLSPLTPFKALFYRAGIVRALERAARLIAISSATADSILRHFPAARPRLRVIPHGIEARFLPPLDVAAVRRRVAEKYGITESYFLVVGQNTPSKNHLGVLRAFAGASLPDDVRLVFLQRLYRNRAFGLLGDGLSHAQMLGVASKVSFLPGVADEDVVELLQGALALVQFSRFEGFGMPALEAMAAGTPVIASEIPALVEVLGGAGLTVPLRTEALGRALERIAREPCLRSELSERGLERARSFSWQRSAERHLEVYRDASTTA